MQGRWNSNRQTRWDRKWKWIWIRMLPYLLESSIQTKKIHGNRNWNDNSWCFHWFSSSNQSFPVSCILLKHLLVMSMSYKAFLMISFSNLAMEIKCGVFSQYFSHAFLWYFQLFWPQLRVNGAENKKKNINLTW